MTASFFSQVWYKIGGLTPRLVPHAEVSRHSYRGQGWYVLHDRASGKVHRFTPAAWILIGRMTGRESVDALWRRAVEMLGDDAPSQDDVVRLLAQLHASDLLSGGVEPDAAELLARFNRTSRRELLQKVMNPMALRIPLWDPTRFLDRTMPAARLLMGRAGAALWLLVVAAGLLMSGLRWPELTEGLYDRVFSLWNLAALWVAYPLVKAAHELGHGYAARARGVPVHEMGIMMLVLFPAPYVEASAAAALPDKRDRALIGAAGILVELFLGALAVLAWSVLEPGFLRAVAFNAALIGGVSTLLLNGNPLLRFDGYYVLCDLAELPNLGQRSTRFWGRLAERRVFGAEKTPAEESDLRERLWMVFYAPLAWVWRMALTLSIALLVAGKFLGLGMLLAAWGIFMSVVLPMGKALLHVFRHERLARVRRRAVGTTLGGIAGLGALLFAVPAPMRTVAEGMIWLPETAMLRAGTDGFVAAALVPQGAWVKPGDPLILLSEPVADTRIALAGARVRAAEARLRAAQALDRTAVEPAREALSRERAALAREIEERGRLVLRAGAEGAFDMPSRDDMEGRFVRRGEVLGHVLASEPRRVLALVPQEAMDLVRRRLRSVEVLALPALGGASARAWRPFGAAAEDADAAVLSGPIRARVLREVPAAADLLPHAGFATAGGGAALSDPSDPRGLRAVDAWFQVELELERPAPAAAYGAHALVRFRHAWMPVGVQAWRALRLLALRELDV